MRFTVVAYGSEGGTRPIVALCRGLMEAAHELRLFCEQSAAETVRNHGVSATVLAGDIKATLPIDNPSSELIKSYVMRAIREMSRLIRDSTDVRHRARALGEIMAEDKGVAVAVREIVRHWAQHDSLRSQ